MTVSSPAFDLRISLEVAARTAYLDGATDEQIDTIVALARGSNDYNVGISGRLTKAEAGRIIDHMFASGADPEFRKDDDELAAEREHAARAVATAAAKKIAKKQDKEIKALRDQADAKKGAELIGQRVHNKYQKISGTVVSQHGNRVMVAFDGEDTPRLVSVDFVKAGEL